MWLECGWELNSSVFWFSREELDNVLNRAGMMVGMLNSRFETALQKQWVIIAQVW